MCWQTVIDSSVVTDWDSVVFCNIILLNYFTAYLHTKLDFIYLVPE